MGESEYNLCLLSDRLENWLDHSVIRNHNGEISPELLRAMLAIRRYKMANHIPVSGYPVSVQAGGKWEFDIG